jgi:hypothetical protein
MAVLARVVRLVSVGLPLAGLAFAQYQGQDPVKVSVSDLTSMSGRYNESPVIVQGELRYGDNEDSNFNIFELRGDDALRVVRVGSPPRSFEDLRFMAGQRVEITGIFFDLESVLMPEQHPVLRYFPGAVRRDAMGMNKQYFIAVTGAEVIEEIKSELDPIKPADLPEVVDPDIDPSSLTDVDLRELVKEPSRYMGKQITVLGKFRGSNLYGDLSIKEKRTPRDFIIKVGEAAIWVTGRRAAGKGFRLDPNKRRDTGEWLHVIGEPWESDGTLYLKAMKIELAKDPEDPDLEPVKVARAEDQLAGPPPEVTFTLPIGGDRSIPLDSQFQVQFSKDMKGESFHRNVDLLYADDDGIGNPFPSLEVSYDGPSRTLTVKPNQTLAPEKEIRLILYDSIEDLEGQKLPADPGATDVEPGAAVVLTFTTAKG